MIKTYQFGEVVALGASIERTLTRPRLTRFVDAGIIRPFRAGAGKGNPRAFSLRNIVEAVGAERAHLCSINEAGIRLVVEAIRKCKTQNLRHHKLDAVVWFGHQADSQFYRGEDRPPAKALMMPLRDVAGNLQSGYFGSIIPIHDTVWQLEQATGDQVGDE